MTQPHYINRLIGFAVHDEDCTVNRFPGPDPCSCGLSALLREARHARRDAPMEAVAWREALARQLDNMSFILNRVDLHKLHDKFEQEMTEDRLLLAVIPTQEDPKDQK